MISLFPCKLAADVIRNGNFRGKGLAETLFVKTPLHKYMEVERSGRWAHVDSLFYNLVSRALEGKSPGNEVACSRHLVSYWGLQRRSGGVWGEGARLSD